MEKTASLNLIVPKIRLRRMNAEIVLKIAAVFLLPFLGAHAHASLFLVFAFWSILGPKQALEALSLSWLATFLNPGLYTLSGLGEVLRWVVLLAAFISVATRYILTRGDRLPRAWFWLFGFVVVALTLSYFTSYAFSVSFFKLLTFFLGTTTVLLAYEMTCDSSDYWKSWFLSIFVLVVLLSSPFFFSTVGYFRNGRGFQGLLNHPQAYGSFLGPLCAWLFFLLSERERRSLVWWGFFVLSIFSLFETQSRTGMLAFLISPIIVISLKLLKGDLGLKRLKKGFLSLAFITLLLLPIFLVIGQQTLEVGRDFVFKSTAYDTVEEAFQASRGALILRSYQNYLAHPLWGIGFGVGSDPSSFETRREPITGLPLGAPAEKGILIVAVLEEVGLVGFSFFCILLISLLFPIFKKGTRLNPPVLAVAAFIVNFGESVFFSFGGTGLWVWLLIGLSRSIARRKV